MDNKEKFITLWEEAGGEQAEKGILKKIAKKLKVPEGTIRRWKSEHIKKNKVNVRRTNAKNERSVKGNEHKKKKAYSEVMKGKTLEKVAEETGTPKSTLFHWSAKYKWQVERELFINKALQDVRFELFGDTKKKIEEVLSWFERQLVELSGLIESSEKDDVYFINSKMAMIDKYLKMQFKLLGIRYTGELADLIRTMNQVSTDEKKNKLEREKFEHEKEQTGSSEEKENEIVELLRKGFGKNED